jgi:hypothetical protein
MGWKGIDWINLAENKGKWTVVNTVMNLLVA